MFALLILFSCASSEKKLEDSAISDEPIAPAAFLKIEEVYYAGSVPAEGIDRYYADQFIQLRNISEHTLDIGGMGIGDIFGRAGEINAGYSPDAHSSDADNLYFQNLWQVPMDSPYRYLPPNGCIKIAQDAADHRPYSDLSHFDAHFETYVEQFGEDKDDPIVENLESIHYTAGYDWLITVFGPTLVLVEAAAMETGQVQVHDGWELFVTSSIYTIDTMEALMDADSGAYKRLHPDIDSGFQYVSGTYTGESVRRKKEGDTLVDTDNSTTDFYVTTPVADCSAE